MKKRFYTKIEDVEIGPFLVTQNESKLQFANRLTAA